LRRIKNRTALNAAKAQNQGSQRTINVSGSTEEKNSLSTPPDQKGGGSSSMVTRWRAKDHIRETTAVPAARRRNWHQIQSLERK
jgi:hypothetical protein